MGEEHPTGLWASMRSDLAITGWRTFLACMLFVYIAGVALAHGSKGWLWSVSIVGSAALAVGIVVLVTRRKPSLGLSVTLLVLPMVLLVAGCQLPGGRLCGPALAFYFVAFVMSLAWPRGRSVMPRTVSEWFLLTAALSCVAAIVYALYWSLLHSHVP